MAQITKVEAVIAALRKKALLATGSSAVRVGYTQSYAIYVHENLASFHPVGQAKYLEQPMRQLKNEFPKIIKQAMSRGASLAQGLLLAGMRLQRESQQLVPVDTGVLKGSAFTRLEGGGVQ